MQVGGACDAYLLVCGRLSQAHVGRLHVRMLGMMGLALNTVVHLTATRFCKFPRKPGRKRLTVLNAEQFEKLEMINAFPRIEMHSTAQGFDI